MAYVVVFLATRWGSELGGLNVFNTGLSRGMSRVLPKGSRCICYVEQIPTTGIQKEDGVEIRLSKSAVHELVEEVVVISNQHERGTIQGVLIVGHDVKTGQFAIDCATALKVRLAPTPVLSAVVSHMDYFAYGQKKGQTLGQVTDRSRTQQLTVARADHAFAVGPLLQASFQSARSVDGDRSRSPVRRLLPGAAEIADEPLNERPGLQVFIAGRLNLEDDTIKNGVLAIEALLASYSRGKKAEQPAWKYRGKLFICGIDVQQDRGLLNELEKRAQQDSAFEIEAIPFSDRQTEIYKHLASCHLALMPSWHEGFGLTGWEALCAGVPLICSRQSGLAMLLDELRQQLPDVSFHSIEYVNLGGSTVPGRPSPHDVQILADSIARITEDMSERKLAARALAKRLKRDFTWNRTAVELFDATGWILPSSVRWRARQQFAFRSATGNQSDLLAADVVAQVMELLDQLDIERDWGDLCSALNYFSDVGKQAQLAARRTLFEQLKAIGLAIAGSPLTVYRTAKHLLAQKIRNSGCLDVCWRYMAACASIATSFDQFAELLEGYMLDVICEESFLSRELLYYASRFSNEFPHSAKTVAEDFFQPLLNVLDSDVNLQIRLARLVTVFPGWSHVLPSRSTHAAYHDEYERCRKITAEPHDVGALIQVDPSLAPTILSLMSLRSDPARQLADQAVGFLSDYLGTQIRMLWRGDKRLFAGLVSTGVGTSGLLDILRFMADDEDETVRWAALDLAFSRTLRARLEASRQASLASFTVPLTQMLGEIIDRAVRADSGHPWLHREFLHHYLQEHSTPFDLHSCARFTINDFPIARHLFGPVMGSNSINLFGTDHPEVCAARTDAQARVKRVLFVLPPIEMPGESVSRHPSYTSTPPLGLGLVATHVALLGHDVQLADCHRFPELCSMVTQSASSFDFIGFNTVLSTLRSAVEFLKVIRRRTLRTLLVVGGPAAKLDAWRYSPSGVEDQESWDFAISGNVLHSISTLLSALHESTPWPSSPTLIANPHSPILTLRDVDVRSEPSRRLPGTTLSEPEWKEIFVDRRLFTGPSGQYEPARTRSTTHLLHEAHVVMSQGCDWNCAFCTERSSMSGGEKRRSVDSVLHELRQLFSSHEDLRIQFVDDNLLPQIAAIDQNNRVKRAAAMDWSEEFLNKLEYLHNSYRASSGWRGIFRLEDFFEYENQFSDRSFIDLLVRSGCRMLAFGIESGDEEQRRRLKGGNGFSNEQITKLFGRLREAGIHTKAYFILGGRWETRLTAEQTVTFALTSGVTLAYFALYKEFVQASHVLSQQRSRSRERSSAYLDYRQLVIRWDEAFGAQMAGEALDCSVIMLSGSVTATERDCYQQLSALGFRFKDLVKYNDYHSDVGKSAGVLAKVSWDQPTEYFGVVEQAYRRFYLRPKFVESYGGLIESGY